MLGWSLKVSIISEMLLLEEVILGFRSKILVILIKCVLKISDNFLSSETMKSFSKIIVGYKFWVYVWKMIIFSLS